MMMRTRTRGTAPAGDRRGFSIPELLVAVMILGVGVLGLAGSAAIMSRQMTGGAQQTVASQVAESRFETLRGMSCAALANGTTVTRGVKETWTITPGSNSTRRADVTVVFTAGKVQKTRVYTSGLTC